jgi:hypothetical protein
MADGNARSVHLVGSIPLESASDVFQAVSGALNGLVKRIPDGETGKRKFWVMWQDEVVRNHSAFELSPRKWSVNELTFDIFQLKPGVDPAGIDFGPLGYARFAIESYQEFARLRGEGRIRKGTRFQVSLPTPLPVLNLFFEKDVIPKLLGSYERQLKVEVDELCRAIPAEDLAIQWDICHEIVFVIEQPDSDLARNLRVDDLVDTIVRLTDHVPAAVEVGWHLCYGDPGHKHVVEPKDTGVMVDLANRLFARTKRAISWIHMPVPRERDDEGYFVPLKRLRLPRQTEFYLGLVHMTDGLEGSRKRVATASKFVRAFGVATECGLGRRPPESIPDVLAMHRDVAGLS